VLLTRNGDTLTFSPLPEAPPARLFKDFLANVHYISKTDNAYQFLYNEQQNRIEFYHGKTLDSLQSYLKPFIFKISDRLYFQEKMIDGFGTAFGYYEKGTGKKYIRRFINENKLSEYSNDQLFYSSWNIYRVLSDNTPTSLLPHADEFYTSPEFDFGTGEPRGWLFEKNEARANQFEFYKMIYPVFTISDDSIVFFNFATDTIELMNRNGKIRNKVPIAFHKEFKTSADSVHSDKPSNTDWRWGSRLLIDDFSREVYTIFLKNGMVKVQKVDLETGKLKNGTVLPFPFPEKIEIYKDDAYFLIKRDGTNDKWKLVKCKI
jgi:hypothetical protein